ncbi:MAG: AbrB/MazE/SpoVT family DNA-binding domain-containing protein [Bacteroidales bacterium]|nr:AbrB/MazE/SpoVT family DNA-binding domain-containing protein [Bacteroidales bacterium]
MVTIASMSSRGQIVLPISIRKKLGLDNGSQFLVVTDKNNILLKPVKEPSLDEFYALIEQAQETAKKIGLTQKDIDREIKNMRAEIRPYFNKE